MKEAIGASAQVIKDTVGGALPKVALILGSGLNGIADALTDAHEFHYADFPGFPAPTVQGHGGRLLVGVLDGTPLICLQGRVHAYEGHDQVKLGFATRVLAALDVEILIVTNAAGSLNEAAGPGSLMAITDHMNFSGVNPLVGINDDDIGPRFPDMTNAWDPELRSLLHTTADSLDIKLHDGVYVMVKGPNFETPAEIRAFRVMGADAVGMSTVPECLTARHAGMRVVGISSVTNYAAGMTGDELTHHETMEYGAQAAVHLERLLKAFVAAV